jgi:hypothetical protein
VSNEYLQLPVKAKLIPEISEVPLYNITAVPSEVNLTNMGKV